MAFTRVTNPRGLQPTAYLQHAVFNLFFLLFSKMGQPRPLFRLFSVFSNKHYKFLQQIYVKKCPSSIRCRDSNPRPLERESPPITTRPGLPPQSFLPLAIIFCFAGSLNFYRINYCNYMGYLKPRVTSNG